MNAIVQAASYYEANSEDQSRLESKRQEMNDKASELGINHPEVLRLSQEVDQLVWKVMAERYSRKRGK